MIDMNFSESNISKSFKKISRRTVIIIFFLLFFVAIALKLGFDYKFSQYTVVIIEFTDLGPLYKRMPVYYKGYKIGRTQDIQPSKDYKYTLVTAVLFPKAIKLPENTKVKVKKLDSGVSYIELIYPENPSDRYIEEGVHLKGETSVDIQTFMSAQADSGLFDSMADSLSKSLSGFDKSANDASVLINETTLLVRENRPAIKKITANIAKTTQNLSEVSASLNKALSEETLTTSTKNVEMTTESIKNITESIDNATKGLDKTMNTIDSILDEVNGTAKNTNSITNGVKRTMGKSFGTARLMFGKPLEDSPDSCFPNRK